MHNLYAGYQTQIQKAIESAVQAGQLPELGDIASYPISLTPPREESHGDMASNAAMVLAKPAKMAPRAIAELLTPHIQALDGVETVEIAGPGFLNIRLKAHIWRDHLSDILSLAGDYGRSDQGKGLPLNVEFVSANPTGPLHVGHARGTVIGDALANLLAFAGYKVTREYYVNDAGVQIDKLASSLFWRYQEAHGQVSGEMPEGLYPGDYLIPTAKAVRQEYGDSLLNQTQDQWLPILRAKATSAMLDLIRADLARLGVAFDQFSSEDALVQAGKVDQLVAALEARGLIYTGVIDPPKGKAPPEDWEPRPQLLFRASQFGDDSDRPLQKSDGSWTYFASDIAYHYDKFQRGFAKQIDVWGADHAGYVTRMKAALAAASQGKASLEILMCQIVKFVENGQPLRMSKRAGNFVLLQELVEAVGADVVRFFLLTRRHDAPLDFDLQKVKDQSRENPVFYVHYAYARAASVFRQANSDNDQPHNGQTLATIDASALNADEELRLMRLLADWPRQVSAAADAYEPHRLVYFLHDVAGAFHSLWTRGKEDASLRFLQDNDEAGNLARLKLIAAMQQVLANGLALIGVEPLEELR